MSEMTDLERLLALEDIRMLRAKYCQYIDSHRWRDLEQVLAPDAVLDLSGTGAVLGRAVPPVAGREQIIRLFETGFDRLKMLLHIVTIPIIEFEGDDFARGTWRQETFIKENNPDLPGTGITYCTAHDTYRRHDKGWRIESVRVTIDLPL